MSSICKHFVQNAWKKDLCSNCFKSREEHHSLNDTDEQRNNKSVASDSDQNGEEKRQQGRYLSQARSLYQVSGLRGCYRATPAAQMNWKNSLSNSSSEEKIESGGEENGSSAPSGRLFQKNGSWRNGINDTNKPLCNGFEKTKHPSILASETNGDGGDGTKGILKSVERAKIGEKISVSFAETECEVIGYGGDCQYSSDEENDDTDDNRNDSEESDDEDDECTSSSPELHRLTKKNTAFNTNMANLKSDASANNRRAWLSRLASDSDHVPIVVTVRPFEARNAPMEEIKPMTEMKCKEECIVEADEEPPALPQTPPPSVEESDAAAATAATAASSLDNTVVPSRSSFLHGLVAPTDTPGSSAPGKPTLHRRPPILKEKPKIPVKPKITSFPRREAVVVASKDESEKQHNDSLTEPKEEVEFTTETKVLDAPPVVNASETAENHSAESKDDNETELDDDLSEKTTSSTGNEIEMIEEARKVEENEGEVKELDAGGDAVEAESVITPQIIPVLMENGKQQPKSSNKRRAPRPPTPNCANNTEDQPTVISSAPQGSDVRQQSDILDLASKRPHLLTRVPDDKKKSKLFSVRRLLRFGHHRDGMDMNEPKKDKVKLVKSAGHKSVKSADVSDCVERNRLEIIHPLDLMNKRGVEVISSARGLKKTCVDDCSTTDDKTSGGSTSSDSQPEGETSSVRSETSSGTNSSSEQISHRRRSSGVKDDEGTIALQSFTTSKESTTTFGHPVVRPSNSVPITLPIRTSEQRGKPPLPPERTVASKPARPPPPKSLDLRKISTNSNKAEETPSPSMSPDSVYANLGEVRYALAPSKPHRSSSLRETSADALTNKRPAPRPPNPATSPDEVTPNEASFEPPNWEDSYECVMVRRSSDYLTSQELKSTRKESCSDSSPIELKSSSSLGSDIYSLTSGDERRDDESEGSTLGLPRRKVSRLSLRQGRTIVHRNFEDNYGAVITANHEALNKVFDQIVKNRPSPLALAPLKAAANLCWNDFTIENDVPCLSVGQRAFYAAKWNSLPVSLMVGAVGWSSGLQSPAPKPNSNLFSISPLATFVDFIPKHLVRGCAKEDGELIQATVWAIPRLRIETVDMYSSTHVSCKSNEKEHERDTAFTLLQLVNSLKYLQAQGIEELPLALVLLSQEDRDPNYRLFLLNEEAQAIYSQNKNDDSDGRLSLCQCALLVLLKLYHVEDAENKLHDSRATFSELPDSFSTVAAILQQEKAMSLSHVKSILEYILWGPSETLVGVHNSASSKEQEQAMQRWLDLERATVLNNLIKTHGLWQFELSVLEEYHLLFLVRTCAKMLREASMQLNAESSSV